jgi:hypothetical protein
MTNIKTIIDQNNIEHIIIYNEDDSFVSMPKAIYDAQIAASDTLPSNSSIPQAGE